MVLHKASKMKHELIGIDWSYENGEDKCVAWCADSHKTKLLNKVIELAKIDPVICAGLKLINYDFNNEHTDKILLEMLIALSEKNRKLAEENTDLRKKLPLRLRRGLI